MCGIIPPSCVIGNIPASQAVKKCTVQNNPQKAVEFWQKGLRQTNISELNLTIKTTEALSEIVKEMIQGVQKDLGKITTYTDSQGNSRKITFTLKIETLSKEDLESAVTSGDYQIAFYPLKATKSSPVSFLQELSQTNLTGFDSEKFDLQISKAANSGAEGGVAEICYKAQKEIIKTYSICPAYYESGYYACADGVSGIQFHAGSGRVCFVNAQRKD